MTNDETKHVLNSAEDWQVLDIKFPVWVNWGMLIGSFLGTFLGMLLGLAWCR